MLKGKREVLSKKLKRRVSARIKALEQAEHLEPSNPVEDYEKSPMNAGNSHTAAGEKLPLYRANTYNAIMMPRLIRSIGLLWVRWKRRLIRCRCMENNRTMTKMTLTAQTMVQR